MAIITISREFGAGGSRVAHLVAGDLAAELVDRTLIAEVARRLEFPEPDVERTDEHPEPFVDRLLRGFRGADPWLGLDWQSSPPSSVLDPRQAIVGLTQQIIREAAMTGNAVIVGRGAAFVLRDHPGTLHVFLRSPEAIRQQVVMERLILATDEARRRIHKTDADRAEYVRRLYHVDWRDSANYDLVINTGRLGFDGAADLIITAVARRSVSEPLATPSPATPEACAVILDGSRRER